MACSRFVVKLVITPSSILLRPASLCFSALRRDVWLRADFARGNLRVSLPTGAGSNYSMSAEFQRGGPPRSYPATEDSILDRDPDFPCVVQLMGIESPGLTSALSITEDLRGAVAEILN